MQKIIPHFWFDTQAEEAVNLYTSLFKNSRIVSMMRYPEGMPVPAGTLMTATFELDGQEFMALNGEPQFKFNEAVSFFVKCDTQEEVDHFWYKLIEGGGEESQCGWLKDKFGVSWQIVPNALGKLMGDPDPVKSQNVIQAMLQMKKIVIKDLQDAHDKA